MSRFQKLSIVVILLLTSFSLSGLDCEKKMCELKHKAESYRSMADQIEQRARRLTHVDYGDSRHLHKRAQLLRHKACKIDACIDEIIQKK